MVLTGSLGRIWQGNGERLIGRKAGIGCGLRFDGSPGAESWRRKCAIDLAQNTGRGANPQFTTACSLHEGPRLGVPGIALEQGSDEQACVKQDWSLHAVPS